MARPDQHPRLADDGGAVIVEAALIMPLLLLFVAGIIDFGIGLRSQTTLQTATRNAARAGAAAVSNTTADQLVLSTLQAGIQSSDQLRIVNVLVYEANAADGLPTANCLGLNPSGLTASGIANICNAYSAQQLAVAANNPGSFVYANATCTTGWDRYWCPRLYRTANLTGTVDALGVYVRATYTPYTDVFGTGDFAMTDHVVMKLEPAPG